ncbi:hypothetical protein H5410_060295 [Solanum commersonii]|uniref:Uncharacterized protein n=1 Tax=Solanum commersonii TaxID=4109 RepID=A0A9J5W531_SOLCO|nr:hypothetical protein H5410_060295 [Solanum commersonii]
MDEAPNGDMNIDNHGVFIFVKKEKENLRINNMIFHLPMPEISVFGKLEWKSSMKSKFFIIIL